MPHCFDLELPHNPVIACAAQHRWCSRLRQKNLTGEPFDPHYFIGQGGISSEFEKESRMAWKAPKIVEVSVGMEINMYMCATRK
jgi:coenzyme PQQ precursor peptide PqqA